jgi:hypothetical protein
MTISIFPTPQWIEGDAKPLPVRPPQHVLPLQVPAAQDWISAHGITVRDGVHQPGGYLLDIRPEGILVAGYDAAGCFYGEQSLAQLTASADIPQVTVQDWPYKPIRGIHLYMPGRKDIPFFKNLLTWLASMKYNMIFLEVSGGMRYHSHPEVNAAWEKFCREAEAYPGGPYALQVGSTKYIKDSTHTELGGGSFLEQSEVRQLLDYASSLFIEVVPEVQSMSHCYYLCCAHPEIAELPDDPWPDTYCPSNPQSYELYFDILEEAIAVFKPRIMHIGHDEIYNLGVCPRCQGRSGNDILAGDLLKIHTFLKERGVRMAMWGDTLIPFSLNGWEGGVARHVTRKNGSHTDIPETFRAIDQLPRDIIISEWQGNTNPMAMRFFIKEGFDVYCGNFGDNFKAHSYPSWNERSVSSQMLGGEPSTWCAVSEYAFAYNGCLFDFAFSAELLWWSHYRDSERGRLTAQIAAMTPQARQVLGDHPSAAGWGGESGESLPLPGSSTLPFAQHLQGCLLDSANRNASIPVQRKAASLMITHACQTDQRRRPTWEHENVYQQPETENLMAIYTIHYLDGAQVSIPVYYGTQVARWDVPYGEHIDAIPYEADPCPMGNALTGQPITAYQIVWTNPAPEKEIQALEISYTGVPAGALWLLQAMLYESIS